MLLCPALMHGRWAPPAPKLPHHSEKHVTKNSSAHQTSLAQHSQVRVHPRQVRQHAACLLIVNDCLCGRSACPIATCWLSRACCLVRGGLSGCLHNLCAVDTTAWQRLWSKCHCCEHHDHTQGSPIMQW